MAKKAPKSSSLDSWAVSPRGRKFGPPSELDRPNVRELVERYVSMVLEGKTARSAAEFAAWLRSDHGVTANDNTVQGWVRKVRESNGQR
jgi:hypothetical protein